MGRSPSFLWKPSSACGPAYAEPEPRLAPDEDRSLSMAQLHAPILIVDDEQHIRQTLQLLLETAGYQADVADDGEAALAMCQAHPYNLALVDVQMPKMNGLELLRS